MNRTLIGLAVVTVAEVAGLVFWLRLARTGQPVPGFLALIAGEAIEWGLLAYMIAKSPLSHPLKTGRVPSGLVKTGLVALLESILWVSWLFLIPRIGLAAATVVIAVLMHVKHDLDIAVFTGRSRLKLLDPKDLTASAFEMGGAAGWFALTDSGHAALGILVLAACITIEHILQFMAAGFFEPDPRPTSAPS
jgi:hypothetical protein